MRRLLLAAVLAIVPATTFAQTVAYTATMPKPTASILHVVMDIRGATGATVDVAMPAWSPGAYNLHWAAKNVTGFTAADGDGRPLEARMVDTSLWRIRPAAPVMRVQYDVYVGANGMDDQHLSFNGTRMLMYVIGKAPYPAPGALTLNLHVPAGWKLATGLDQPRPGVFTAPDYDTLIDSPIDASPALEILSFDTQGAQYDVAITGTHDYDRNKLIGDLRKIVVEQVRMMGGTPPYKRYVFFFRGNNGQTSGGLEHLNSTSITFGRYAGTIKDAYNRFMFVVSHEFFHLWNVKRIRPAILGPFDYAKPQHTRNLYVSEGMTSYFAALALVRSGVWDRATFYVDLAKAIQELQEQPGHLVTSAEMSSFLTWNRPDNASNVMISYYTKGQIVGTLLDLELRARTGNRKTLDDTFRTLYAEFGLPNPGFPEEGGFEGVMGRMNAQGGGSGDFRQFFASHVSGLEEIAYDAFLSHVGLKLQIDRAAPVRSLGVTTRTDADRLIVNTVPPSGAGHEAGLMPGDVLLSLDDERVVPATFQARLNVRREGDRVNLRVMRGDREVLVPLALQEDRAPTYRIVEDASAPVAAKALRDQWLAPYGGR